MKNMNILVKQYFHYGGYCMSDYLRPCPFCGGEPEVSYGKGKCRVSCTKCITMVAYYADNTYAEYEIEAKAIAMWNRRVNT